MPNTKEGLSRDELAEMLESSFRPKECFHCSQGASSKEDVEKILKEFDSWAVIESSFDDKGKDFSILSVFKHNGSDVPQMWDVIYQRYVPGF